LLLRGRHFDSFTKAGKYFKFAADQRYALALRALVVLLIMECLGPDRLGDAAYYAGHGVGSEKTNSMEWDEIPPIDRPLHLKSIDAGISMKLRDLLAPHTLDITRIKAHTRSLSMRDRVRRRLAELEMDLTSLHE
jgi:hypothetical protein